MHRHLIPLFLALAVPAAARSQVVLRACPPGGLPADTLPPGSTRPTAADVPLTPLPVPAGVRGTRVEVRVLVDTTGRAVADSVTVCGARDAAYARRLAVEVRRVAYRPARRDGQVVVGATRFVFDF